MIKIGITGGIGSGKSIVASLLNLHGIPVYLADTESKILTATSPVIRGKLIALLGKELYTEEGLLNKKLLASYIFSNPEYLKEVNAIIHPEVKRHFTEWAERQLSEFCAIESAILFESGFNQTVDKSLMVYAPLELRIGRAMQRDNVSRGEIISRINNQLPDETKKERSDYVIHNDDIQALLPQVGRFLATLRNDTAE